MQNTLVRQQGKHVLIQVTDPEVLCIGNATARGGVFSDNKLQQRCLPCSVRTYQAGLIAGFNMPIRLVKQGSGPYLVCYIVYRYHFSRKYDYLCKGTNSIQSLFMYKQLATPILFSTAPHTIHPPVSAFLNTAFTLPPPGP